MCWMIVCITVVKANQFFLLSNRSSDNRDSQLQLSLVLGFAMDPIAVAKPRSTFLIPGGLPELRQQLHCSPWRVEAKHREVGDAGMGRSPGE